MTSVERDSPKQSGSSEKEARKGSAGKRYTEKKDVIDVETAKGKDRGRDRDEERRKGRGEEAPEDVEDAGGDHHGVEVAVVEELAGGEGEGEEEEDLDGADPADLGRRARACEVHSLVE